MTSKLSTFILDRQDENLRRNLDMICKEFMNKVGNIMNKEIWMKKIRYINNLKDEELIRLESFSVIVSFMLSKEAFRANVDLKIFMEELGIECKPYLAKSRTAMLAKMLRIC